MRANQLFTRKCSFKAPHEEDLGRSLSGLSDDEGQIIALYPQRRRRRRGRRKRKEVMYIGFVTRFN